MPKARGFTRYYKLVKEVAIINIGVLDADERISDAMEISKQLLKDLGYIKSATVCVKILWHGDYTKHLTFLDIDTFSASAKTKMEKPGTVHSIAKKAPVKVKKDKKSKVGKLKIKTSLEKTAAKHIEKKVVVKEPVKAEEKKAPVAKKASTKSSSASEKPVVKKAPAKAVAKPAKPAVKKTTKKA